MKFIRVPRSEGERIRRQLIDAGAFVHGYSIISGEQFLLFPVNVEKWHDYEIVERDAKKLPEKYLKLKGLLMNCLTETELEELTTSYDVIGDIIIAEIPEGLEGKEKIIADALLKVNPSVKVVTKKLGPMEGEFRVRRIKVIGGEGRTETVYKEHGCRMKLDVGKVYFSVRLGTERKRIAELVQPGEKILALFAGVGPFALVISKTHPDSEIVAIELNPDAVEYMKENIALNKMENITPVLGDAREIVMKSYQGFADRIIMPLPKSAAQFLDVAIAGAKDGGTIHFYTFDAEGKSFPEARKAVMEAAGKAGVKAEFLNEKIVRPYAPGLVQVVIDFKVRK
ncbi:MAG: class I SAM-dependent methyltransferase family protein [Candidatus Micrarchaeota archaeon]